MNNVGHGTGRPESADVCGLAEQLLRAATGESVRVIEALAVTMLRAAPAGLSELPASFEHETANGAVRRACLRIIRRASSGCIPDPTAGANAWHRHDESPAWAEDQLPVAEVGPFLFYRL